MITDTDKLVIRRLSLDCIQVKEYQPRYPKRLDHYIQLMQYRPYDHCGLVSVTPSPTHEGMYVLLDGHHRYCAAIMTGKRELLCLVVVYKEEQQEERAHDPTTTR